MRRGGVRWGFFHGGGQAGRAISAARWGCSEGTQELGGRPSRSSVADGEAPPSSQILSLKDTDDRGPSFAAGALVWAVSKERDPVCHRFAGQIAAAQMVWREKMQAALELIL